MPQMSPIMWFSLFIMFSIVMIMFNQMNFFCYKPKTITNNKEMKTKSNKLMWKW
uniref:ATP synthase complex subunit 8 n=1 Tax=Acrida cinerea TaxID=244713 RepID=E7BXR0_ACRCI|nr:ATP synthase F0 subunit 8 [Acrida cinerea]ADB43142.1 ATP synthase F0 subunit 8 [Acrida cinerea]APD14833.1 ATP synthase F0 subunit 8 [Acrida cinerea]